MLCSVRLLLRGIALLVLVPSVSWGQTVARSFEELQALLKTNPLVILIEKSGDETWGKVTDVSPSSVTLVIMQETRDGVWTTKERRTFTEERIAMIMRSDESGAKGTIVFPASWDKVHALQPGSRITVFLEGGDRRSYRLTRAADATLELLTPDGGAQTVRKSQVERLVRDGFSDPVGNGIAIGALAGAGAALALVTAGYAACNDTCDAPARGPTFLAAAGFGSGIGALAGFLVDKLHKGSEVLYPATGDSRRSINVSPILSTDRQGLSVSITF